MGGTDGRQSSSDPAPGNPGLLRGIACLPPKGVQRDGVTLPGVWGCPPFLFINPHELGERGWKAVKSTIGCWLISVVIIVCPVLAGE